MELFLQYKLEIIGGLLIGIAAGGMLLSNGRILGVSGIIGGLLKPQNNKENWRYFFLIGLVAGTVWYHFNISPLTNNLNHLGTRELITGGLLVGYGATLGNGCTSGHGVCGMSRFSLRSIVATLTFVISGIITVLIVGV